MVNQDWACRPRDGFGGSLGFNHWDSGPQKHTPQNQGACPQQLAAGKNGVISRVGFLDRNEK